MITDAQVHLWPAETIAEPWLPGGRVFAHGDALGADTVIESMHQSGVHSALLVPPSWVGDSNAYCLAAARSHPREFAVAGRLPLHVPLTSAQLLAWRSQPGMVGARLTFARGEAARWLSDGTADWFWPRAEEARLPVFVYAPGQLSAISAVAKRYPALQLTIDHLGLRVGLHDDELGPVLDELVRVAYLPNIAVKATALPSYTSESYPFTSLHDRIRRVLESFGPHRVFWGSDLSRLPGSYDDCVRLFTEALDFLNTEDLDRVMGGGLRAWIGWDD